MELIDYLLVASIVACLWRAAINLRSYHRSQQAVARVMGGSHGRG